MSVTNPKRADPADYCCTTGRGCGHHQGWHVDDGAGSCDLGGPCQCDSYVAHDDDCGHL